MSRINWAKAKSRLTYQFVEWPDTWPAMLSARHLARLQAESEPENGRKWQDEIKAVQSAIDAAAAAGEIPHVIQTFTFAPSAFSSPLFGSAEARTKARLDACYSLELPAIAASYFAQWLTAQGQTPSAHIAAWVQSVTPAPVVTTGASNGVKWTPEKLAELRAYRDAHTMPETAKEFGIAEQRIRKLLPSTKPRAKPFSTLIHRIK